jgi:putative transposase
VHFYRNIFSHVPATKVRDVAHMLKAIHAQESREAAEQKARTKIRTNNPLERIMREIRRRTRVVGAFPDGQSCINLAAARFRYIAASAWSTKRYMNMRPLYESQVIQTGAVA